MKWTSLIAALVGLAAVVALVALNNVGQIFHILLLAGWGVLAVIAIHLPATFLAALGWRAVIAEHRRPTYAQLFKIRWIKEAVNALLPVAQVGGEFVRGRLLLAEGVALKTSAASCIVDVVAGTISLFVYTVMGLTAFLLAPHDLAVAGFAERAVFAGGAVAVVVLIAPRLGLLRLVEVGVKKLSTGGVWASLVGTDGKGGLHAAVLALYRQPRRMWVCAGWHLAAWGWGAVETFVALTVLGLHPTLAEAFVIDSLGQGLRAAGFAVPGALGVQEGGYILVCHLFGIGAEQALALSFIRRIRELALGLPGLAIWARTEGWTLKGRRKA